MCVRQPFAIGGKQWTVLDFLWDALGYTCFYKYMDFFSCFFFKTKILWLICDLSSENVHLKVFHFLTENRAQAVHNLFRKNFHLWEQIRSSVQEKLPSVRAAWVIRSDKNSICVSGKGHLFRKNCSSVRVVWVSRSGKTNAICSPNKPCLRTFQTLCKHFFKPFFIPCRSEEAILVMTLRRKIKSHLLACVYSTNQTIPFACK